MEILINTSRKVLFFQLVFLAGQYLAAVVFVFYLYSYFFEGMPFLYALCMLVCSWFFFDANVNFKKHIIYPKYEIQAKNRRHHRAIKRSLMPKYGRIKRPGEGEPVFPRMKKRNH